jgi:hypothetical protein
MMMENGNHNTGRSEWGFEIQWRYCLICGQSVESFSPFESDSNQSGFCFECIVNDPTMELKQEIF